MSGIYIPGMEMARKCIRCPVNVYGRCLINDDKDVSKVTADAVRDKDCPLIPVPDHGRLIDADAFERRCMFDPAVEDMQDVIYALRDYPTIIPAEDGEG